MTGATPPLRTDLHWLDGTPVPIEAVAVVWEPWRRDDLSGFVSRLTTAPRDFIWWLAERRCTHFDVFDPPTASFAPAFFTTTSCPRTRLATSQDFRGG